MNFRTVQTIFRKEILDTMRDKRTLLAMIGVPLLLYPALFILATQAAIVQMGKMEEKASRVAVTAPDVEAVAAWLEDDKRIEIVSAADPQDALFRGDVEAVVLCEADLDQAMSGHTPIKIVIQYDATEQASQLAHSRIREVLGERELEIIEQRLAEAGLNKDFADPFQWSSENKATAAKTTGSLLGMLLPLIMVVMVGLGAFYPAVDLTAGEKERGTFETLLSTPTSKLEIVTGKFLTVFLISMVTAVLNLGSLALTFWFQLSKFQHGLGDLEFQLAPSTFLVILLALIPLAFFISAMMMSVAVFARSFREAQNFVTPFFLLILFPAGLSSLPGIELSRATQFLPVGNVALLFKALLVGKADVENTVVVLVSTSIYAVMALLLAKWLFQREDIILSEERGVPLTFRRARFRLRNLPTPGMAIMLFCVVMLLLFYIGTYVQERELISGILITQYGLILFPTVFLLWYARVNLRQSLNLRLPSMPAVPATLLIAFGWTFLLLQLGIWQEGIFPLPDELKAAFEEMSTMANRLPAIWLILLLAVSPGLCEEVLFRGAIFSGLRKRMPAWALILTVGVLFGAFHLIIHKLVLTGISGILLTYLVWRTRSIFCTMAAHAIINGTALTLGSRFEEGGVPGWLLALSCVGLFAGVAMLERFERRNGFPEAEDEFHLDAARDLVREQGEEI
ncbi:MAG: ABC transporter permease subunit [Candidatus Hydrogenedentes bacterium]|nr:ABC transporter permease subunit [Candidatus Hydrogenedentota bacterium]